ncbi:hypothetical protein PTSG_06523 [Salpingoeca rosetta]|uniref:Roc domain-containing protein n=1 Tax=Salpingoeca rosetta (strain ATCC 50818 / BSB-021) TaxID=946362 RepID=F2UG22_SALR5|nr:uncharacterized protein PTSG_06523 [Salpingoeca rosetta]EGD75450.1 hypothetical protein PTSG_06523 [Salpingoeca rosetta]|eukprot:XP_004991907.1 hypothetical protein PTSG_06523 [Salpingoeca rosetta]
MMLANELTLDGTDPERLKAITAALKVNTTLISLAFEENALGPEGCTAIAEALKMNTALTSLHLYSNSLGPAGGTAIGEALKVNTTLTSLNLAHNDIGREGGTAIGEALKVNTTLTSLNLAHNDIGREGGTAIGEALKFNTTLTSLNIGSNSISGRLESAINSALKRNKQLAARTEELVALLEHGSVPLSTAKVFVCGHYGIGKTTLINTLQSAPKFFNTMVRRRRKTYDEPDRPDQRTPGIEMYDFALTRGKSSGSVSLTPSPTGAAGGSEDSSSHETTLPPCKLRVYDFAGQVEYHVVHELLFADHNAVFVVCVDVSKAMANVEASVLYWLRFIKTRLHQAVHRSAHPPHVFIVGTKADKPHEHNTLVKMTADALPHESGISLPPMQFPSGDALLQSRQLQEWFGDTMRIHPHVIPLNCHDLGGACMHHLRDLLHAAWMDVVQQDIQVPNVVELIAEGLQLCRKEGEGPWALHRLFPFVSENIPGIETIAGWNEDIFFKALRCMLTEVEEEIEGIEYDHFVLSHAHLSSYRPHPAGYPLQDVEDAAAAGETLIIRSVDNVSSCGKKEHVRDELKHLLREDLFLAPVHEEYGNDAYDA